MQIKQWQDKNLAQFSYGILSDDQKKIILIDPSRNPKPYLDWAGEYGAKIIGIIETHPHADFVSSHLELQHLTGSPIYVHSLLGASYPHIPFDDGATIEMGKIKLTSLHTPGHSPDSISILLEYDGTQRAVFTGDTLFIGDCGRPDLRESAGNIQSKREDLAKQLYYSLRNKLMKLRDDVIVYPGHGAGSLCGKNLSHNASSSIFNEKLTNWSLQQASESEFVENLLKDQPFIPQYFPYDVELNRKGAPALGKSISAIEMKGVVIDATTESLDPMVWIIDGRKQNIYAAGHLAHSINLMEDGSFETWLGTIIKPGEKFYLAGESREQVQRLIQRTAAIGYEMQIEAVLVPIVTTLTEESLNVTEFKNSQNNYTIVDVRGETEAKHKKVFSASINIPLTELRERVREIPIGKPIVVHCASGYRSAAGSSIIKSILNGNATVYNLSEAVKQFM
ncbi:MAG: MBL fold metallo-hydrolase [Chitinophagaceae bacterium]|nr:MBL fold metallo-hydrolase [Chitinophagaceae bacterium]